jgi:hypothetical protein
MISLLKGKPLPKFETPEDHANKYAFIPLRRTTASFVYFRRRAVAGGRAVCL